MADSRLEDYERVFRINEVDCHPPPGAVADFNKPDEVQPMVLDRFLQNEERARLSLIELQDNTQLRPSDEIGAILGKLGVGSLKVFYDADSYRDALKVVPCFKAKVYLRIRFDVFEVRVTANEDITVPGPGGPSFPKGDEIATFRVSEPKQWRFEVSYEYDPKCCPVRPERVPEDKVGGWIPSDTPSIQWMGDGFKLKPKIEYNFGE